MLSHLLGAMMKGVGKIGSALAAFEDNIAKNHEHFKGGRSFLTTIAANPSTPKKIIKAIEKRKKSGRKGDSCIGDYLRSSEHSKIYDSCGDSGDEEIASCTTLSTTAHSPMTSQESQLLKLKVNDNTSRSDGTAPGLKVVKKPVDGIENNDEKKSLESTSVTNSRVGGTKKSAMQKIAATIERVNKSNSFREAAKAAAALDVSSESKSRTSKSTPGGSATMTTSLDDFVLRTTPKDYKKSLSEKKLVSSSHEIAAPAQLAIVNATECETMVKKNSNHAVAMQRSTVKLSDYVSKTDAGKIVDKSVTSLPIASVTPKSHLDDQSFVSLPGTSLPRGIAVAARRSSINMIAAVNKQNFSAQTLTENVDVCRENDLTNPLGLIIDSLNSEVHSLEQDYLDIDMEYGPHNMSPDRHSQEHKVETAPEKKRSDLPLELITCNCSTASDDESLAGTEATPIGIAKAARRSSVELISSAAYREATGIAKAARRSSVELSSRTECDETLSVSALTTISEDSTMASSRTDEHDRPSTEERNIQRRPQKQSSINSILSLDTFGRKNDYDPFGSLSTVIGDSIFLPRRAEVVGILRQKSSVRNVSRRVSFADQQPGGGRRMSFHKSVKNDSLPIRPRRSSNFELDRLRNLRRKQHTTSTAEPFHFMSQLAATTIQASYRRWVQWKATRPILLAKKLVWIQENHRSELDRIQQEKWDKMEKIQSEIVERERRLEAQVSLAEKLCDHLKRDSAIVQGQTKKLKEFSTILKNNNNQLDHSVRLNRENFFTANLAVEFLREKSDTLLASSKKYAYRIDKMQAELEKTTKRVDVEYRSKVKMKKTIKRILRLLKKRGFDVNRETPCTIQHSAEPIDFANVTGKEFNVTVHSCEGDALSLCSDITNDSMTSMHDETCHDMDTYKKESVKRQISTDSTSLAGNSFASYTISKNVSATQSENVYTHSKNNSASYATSVPVAPRRQLSSTSFFSAIVEEVSVTDKSRGSGDV